MIRTHLVCVRWVSHCCSLQGCSVRFTRHAFPSWQRARPFTLRDSLHQEACGASHPQLKYKEIGLYCVIFADEISTVFSIFFSITYSCMFVPTFFFFQPVVVERVLCPLRSQNVLSPFFNFLLFLSSATVVLIFTSLFCANVHISSHWLQLFLRRSNQTGYAGLISSFAPATPCGASERGFLGSLRYLNLVIEWIIDLLPISDA